MSLKLHTCTISKRGKGAKGTVTVQTIGVPVVPKKGNKKITKKWDYSKLAANTSLRAAIDFIEQVGGLNGKLLIEAVLRGRDLIIKSQSIRNNSEKTGLIAMILELGLSRSKKEAANLAMIWQQTISFAKRSHAVNIPTIEELAELRMAYVSEQKEKNLWVMRPEDDVVKDDDSEESEEDDDSEDDEDDSEDDE